MSARLILWTTRAVTLAVLASLAVAAGKTVWHVAGLSAVQPDRVEIARAADTPDAAPVRLEAAFALAPFGSAIAAAQPEQTATEASLDLVLRGVVMQADPSRSYALITKDGVTQSYAREATIYGAVVLAEIAEQHVVLSVDGQPRILTFPNGAVVTAQAAPSDTPPSGLDRLRAALRVGSGSLEIEDATAPVTTEDYVNLWRGRIIKNPQQVLGEIGLVATEKGYIIEENHDPGVKLAGLKSGDRVARVNGQAVGNVDQDQKFMDDVVASGIARLEVVRDDKTFVVSFPLR